MNRRILLAWEAGAGRGHVVTLKTVAAALGPGFTCDAALCRMDHAGEIAPLCDLVFPAARLRYDRSRRVGPGSVRTSTWGEFLGDSGFRDGARLARQVGWWREVLIARCSDLLVADYAPCALLAAQSLGIPAVVVGTGYSVPPEGLTRFPVFLPEYAERLYDEAEMVDGINAALAPLDVPPLNYLPDIYRRSAELVRTLAMLDPYAEQRDQPLLPPVADVSGVVAGEGDEIFCYFSTTELAEPGIVEAVATLDLPVRAFCPGIAGDVAGRLSASGVILEDAPVPVDLIARRARLMVHSGQHGILCLGLAAGLPQVAVPQHLEHLYHARAAGARVIGVDDRSADTVRQTILDAYNDASALMSALSVAAQVRESLAGDPATMICDRLLPLLG